MPKSYTAHECLRCGAIYKNELAARHCEDDHKKHQKIIDYHFDQGKAIATQIDVLCENGKTYQYKLVEGSVMLNKINL